MAALAFLATRLGTSTETSATTRTSTATGPYPRNRRLATGNAPVGGRWEPFPAPLNVVKGYSSKVMVRCAMRIFRRSASTRNARSPSPARPVARRGPLAATLLKGPRPRAAPPLFPPPCPPAAPPDDPGVAPVSDPADPRLPADPSVPAVRSVEPGVFREPRPSAARL